MCLFVGKSYWVLSPVYKNTVSENTTSPVLKKLLAHSKPVVFQRVLFVYHHHCTVTLPTDSDCWLIYDVWWLTDPVLLTDPRRTSLGPRGGRRGWAEDAAVLSVRRHSERGQ